MRKFAYGLQERGLLLVIPGATSLWEAGAFPMAALSAAFLAVTGIYLLRRSKDEQAA